MLIPCDKGPRCSFPACGQECKGRLIVDGRLYEPNVDDRGETAGDAAPAGNAMSGGRRADVFPAGLTRGAHLLKSLQRLKVGERLTVDWYQWQEITIPPDLDPLGPRLQADERVWWFLHRCAPGMEMRQDPMTRHLHFTRTHP